MNQSEIVLVNLGVFQPYIHDAIQNLQLFGNKKITIITEPHLIKHFKRVQDIQLIETGEFDLQTFEELNQLDDAFRQGFWKNASKRLFYLYHYMKKYGRKNCFHIENDVMVYQNLETIRPTGDHVWLVMDTEKRCIASIMFIPEYRSLDNLVKEYHHDKNDMENMALFFNNNRKLCRPFPIIANNQHPTKTDIFSEHFKTFNSLFDGAAIGQYLGGIDPRNVADKKRKKFKRILNAVGLGSLLLSTIDTSGFVNETCVIDYSKYRFAWIKKSGNYVPHIEIEDEWIPIVNMRIHSKSLKKFSAKIPQETTLLPKLN